MKSLKKAVWIILCALLLWTVAAAATCAADESGAGAANISDNPASQGEPVTASWLEGGVGQYGVWVAPKVQLLDSAYGEYAANSLEYKLYQGLKEGRTEIDVASCHAYSSDVSAALTRVMYGNPYELFNVDTDYSYYDTAAGIVTRVIPTYIYSGGTLTEKREAFQAGIAEILDLVDPAWNDLETILFLHDYLAINFGYDMRLFDNSTKHLTVYYPEQFLAQRTGVCQAYSLTYYILLSKCGITSTYAESDSMNHIWNLVQLGDQWYHIDVTWDDPTDDMLGAAQHDNFLLSDDAIKATGHYAWKATYASVDNIQCSSITYDDCYWRDVSSPFVYYPDLDRWYFLLFDGDNAESDIWYTDEPSIEPDWLYTFCDYWAELNTHYYYVDTFSGLTLYDGCLLYNTPTAICAYDPSTELMQPLLTLDETTATSQNIYGFHVNDNILTYRLDVDPYAEQPLPNQTLELHDVVPPLLNSGFSLGDTYASVRAYEDGQVTVNTRSNIGGGGTAASLLLAARYDASGKMCDLLYIPATSLSSDGYSSNLGALHKGETIKVFALGGNHAPIGSVLSAQIPQ